MKIDNVSLYQSVIDNPWFLTGFTDAEGCFTISIFKNNRVKTGWTVKLSFQIALHEKDITLLEQIQLYFNVGNISKHGSQMVYFRIESIKDLAKIINHFDKYPLITDKKADYELFKRIIEKMNNEEHLTEQGIQEIVNIRASLNLGLSPGLK